MKGRKPKPTAQKLLEGNPGHRARENLGRGEPDPEVMLGEPPEQLNDIGRKFWYAEGGQLLKTRVITAADQAAFGNLCWFHQCALQLKTSIAALEQKKKLTARDENTLAMHYNRLFKLTDRIQKLQTEFGMTPVSRTRVKVDDGQGELDFNRATQSPLEQALAMSRSA